MAAIAPESIMAIDILRAEGEGRPLEIEDISKVFMDLWESDVDVGEVAIRRVPGGVYSEDVEAFVGRLLAAGYATARSPIEFLEDGLQICREIVAEEMRVNPEGIKEVERALDVDVSALTPRAPQPQPA